MIALSSGVAFLYMRSNASLSFLNCSGVIHFDVSIFISPTVTVFSSILEMLNVPVYGVLTGGEIAFQFKNTLPDTLISLLTSITCIYSVMSSANKKQTAPHKL